jgi:hypothetical protein
MTHHEFCIRYVIQRSLAEMENIHAQADMRITGFGTNGLHIQQPSDQTGYCPTSRRYRDAPAGCNDDPLDSPSC